jgi:hypothetical protein
VFVESVKTRIESADCFFYPDVVVTCDPRDRLTPDYISHPTLVVEVLSDRPPPLIAAPSSPPTASWKACRNTFSSMSPRSASRSFAATREPLGAVRLRRRRHVELPRSR